MPARRRAGLSSSGLTGTGLDTVIPITTPAADTNAEAGDGGGRKEKIAAYVPSELAETVRDTVAALGSHIDDPRSLSELLESALRREVQRLQDERHNGEPFPRRARRRLPSGRRAD